MGKMKGGMAVMILAAGLVGLITSYILTYMFMGALVPTDRLELEVDNIIYLMRDSVDAAKLFVDNSARYSLYQAMYDNGKMGGFTGGSAQVISYGGEEYAAWYDGSDISPTEKYVTDSLASAAFDNFMEYQEKLKTRSVTAILPVPVPGYSGMEVENVNGYSLVLKGTGDSDIALSRKAKEGSHITVQKSSLINLTIDAPYFRLFEMSKDAHDAIVKSMGTCTKDAIEKSEDKGCCTIDVKVLEGGEECLVKVEAKSKARYLVWNGKKAALEPITLVFVDRYKEGQEVQEEEPISDPYEGLYFYPRELAASSIDDDPVMGVFTENPEGNFEMYRPYVYEGKVSESTIIILTKAEFCDMETSLQDKHIPSAQAFREAFCEFE